MSAPTRDPVSDLIDLGDLSSGDVLLYRRHSLLGRLILAFDGRGVSHAALYLGSGEGVAEAVGEGLLRRPLPASLGEDQRDYILVYRWNGDVGAAAMTPVIDHARSFLSAGVSYAHVEVLLAAFLALTRKIPLTRTARFLMRAVLDRAALWLLAPPDPNHPRTLMCSEFVYRCYLGVPAPIAPLSIPGFTPPDPQADAFESTDSGQAPPHAIEVGSLLDSVGGLWDEGLESTVPAPPPGIPASVPDEELAVALIAFEAEERDRKQGLESAAGSEIPLGTDPGDQELVRAMKRFASALVPPPPSDGLESTGGGARAVPSLARLRQIIPNFVSPGDLTTSTNLRLVGRVGHS